MFRENRQLNIGSDQDNVRALVAEHVIHLIDVARIRRDGHESALIRPVEPSSQWARVHRDDLDVEARQAEGPDNTLTEESTRARGENPDRHWTSPIPKRDIRRAAGDGGNRSGTGIEEAAMRQSHTEGSAGIGITSPRSVIRIADDVIRSALEASGESA
jgi:hypothetical protein